MELLRVPETSLHWICPWGRLAELFVAQVDLRRRRDRCWALKRTALVASLDAHGSQRRRVERGEALRGALRRVLEMQGLGGRPRANGCRLRARVVRRPSPSACEHGQPGRGRMARVGTRQMKGRGELARRRRLQAQQVACGAAHLGVAGPRLLRPRPRPLRLYVVHGRIVIECIVQVAKLAVSRRVGGRPRPELGRSWPEGSHRLSMRLVDEVCHGKRGHGEFVGRTRERERNSNETDFQSSLGLERLPAVFLNRNSIIAPRSITLVHRIIVNVKLGRTFLHQLTSHQVVHSAGAIL